MSWVTSCKCAQGKRPSCMVNATEGCGTGEWCTLIVWVECLRSVPCPHRSRLDTNRRSLAAANESAHGPFGRRVCRFGNLTKCNGSAARKLCAVCSSIRPRPDHAHSADRTVDSGSTRSETMALRTRVHGRIGAMVRVEGDTSCACDGLNFAQRCLMPQSLRYGAMACTAEDRLRCRDVRICRTHSSANWGTCCTWNMSSSFHAAGVPRSVQ